MSWIKDNKFAVTLGGVTAGLAALLVVAGLQGSAKYQKSLEQYQTDSQSVGDAENLPLYPSVDNQGGKKKAVLDFRESVASLQNSFGKFRPEPSPEKNKIAPQEFTNRLKAANSEVTAAFTAGGTKFPDNFFSGFEGYSTGTLAKENATGILDYELGATKELFLALAKSKPSQLLNVFRQRLPEEDGAAWKPAGPNDVARALPLEVTFKGSETAARNFISALAKSDKYYYVIRTMRISNEKKTPPLATDAKFEAPPAAEASAPADGGFALPPAAGDAAAPAPAAGGAAPAPAEAAAAPAAAPKDSSQILIQVLGKEEVTIFLRLDVMQVLAPKDLPQP